MNEQIRPLQGIRVLEWAQHFAGPGGAAILGDLGAEVIKIEQPGTGDPVRLTKRVGQIAMELPHGRSPYNEGANRSKKSITLNLKSAKGRQIAHRLVQNADVFLTNLRRQVAEKLKMDYETLSAINDKLIYASVSAYGPKGPDSHLGGFDYQGQGRSGWMFSMGVEGSPPTVSQFAIIDQATSHMISHQVLAALLARDRFGIGQEVHASLLGSAMNLLHMNVLIPLLGKVEVPRYDRAKEDPLRNHYCCADGKWLIMTFDAAKREQKWLKFCELVGRPDLPSDPRFDRKGKTYANAAALAPILDEAFAAKPRDEWLRILAENDIFCTAVHKPSELAGDPQILANDYIVDFDHPVLGKIQVPGYPGHFSKCAAGIASAAPELGEHTDEVLGEVGYTKTEIEAFRSQKVI